MFKTAIDPKAFLETMSDLEKRQFPFAASGALNDAMFDVRNAWQQEVRDVFDKPTALTINAILYKKATKQDLTAEVFIRNELPNGTPPSRYLASQIHGTAREEKPFEHILREAGILGADEFVIPARGFPLDPYGNVPGNIVTTILSDLQASRDPSARSTAASRAKRARRKAIGKRAVYFESSPQLAASQGRKQHLPRGIYQRTRLAHGSAIRMAFAIVKGAPRYGRQFDAYGLAERVFKDAYPKRFAVRMEKALETAKIK